MLSIAIPCFGQIYHTKSTWAALAENTNPEGIELVVINNGSPDETAEYLEKEIFPHFPNHKLIQNPENVGAVKSLQQCCTESTGEVVAMLHNDLIIQESGWERRVIDAFEKNPKLGLAGFYGSKVMYKDGGRGGSYSNLQEAEANLSIRTDGLVRVVSFDGLALIARRTMLDRVGGIDTDYAYHHFYDRDISLKSHFGNWENWMIGIKCHHTSGQTANTSLYSEWINSKMGVSYGDGASYQASFARFTTKWAGMLPVNV